MFYGLLIKSYECGKFMKAISAETFVFLNNVNRLLLLLSGLIIYTNLSAQQWLWAKGEGGIGEIMPGLN